MELLNKIYLQYLYFGPLFVMVLAVSKFISKEKLRINYFYTVSHIVLGLTLFQMLSYSTKTYPGYYYVSYFMIPLAIGCPLLLYLRFRFLIQNKNIYWPVSFTVILASVAIFLLTGPIIWPGEFMRNYIELRPILDDSFMALPLYFKIVHFCNFLIKLILSAGLLNLLVTTALLWNVKDSENIMLARVSYIFTILMFIMSIFMIAGDLLNFKLTMAGIAMGNTVIIGIFLASQYDSSYYAIFKYVEKKKKYSISKVQGINVESVINNLNRMMIEKELYKDEDLSINTLAKMLNISVQQLSEILNKNIKKSFSTYVNDFKIEETQRLLVSEPDMPIIRIALIVGFNSVRTFNRVFVKSTGCTPQKYRRMNS